MTPSSTLARGVFAASALAGGAYLLYRRAQEQLDGTPDLAPERALALLKRAAPLLSLPTSPGREPEVMPDGSGLRCPATGATYPFRRGVLDLLAHDAGVDKTFAQKSLDTPFTSWAYDRLRDATMPLFGLPPFAVEVSNVQQRLQAGPGATVLDLCCGHGNFTVEWGKRVGPGGLVLGLDLSLPMLARAAHRVSAWDLGNVLLVHGDAQRLPLRDGAVGKINCSGGLHQLPDLPRALAEIARVSAPGAVLAVSTFAQDPDDPHAASKQWLKERFALHFVPLVWLGQELEKVGFGDYQTALPGGWFGYASAQKARG